MLQRCFGTLVAILMSSGVAAAVPAYPPAPVAPASAEVGRIFDDYRLYSLAEDPIGAGLEGDRAALSKLPGVGLADTARRAKALRDFQARLAAAAKGDLVLEDRVNVQFLQRMVNDALEEVRFDSARIVFNSETGPEEILATIQRAAALRSPEDVEAYLARLSATPRYFDETAANARRGIRTDFTQPRGTTKIILDQLKAQAALPPEADISYQPLRSLPPTIDAAQQDRYRERARTIIASQVRPAERRFAAMLETEYLPKSRDTIGASALPDGKAYYTYLARHFTTTDLTPDQIHAIGLEQVRLTRAAMDREIAASGWRGDFPGFINFLRTDPQFYAKSREELFMRASTVAKQIDGALQSFFATPPRLYYGVVEVPREIEENYTTGRYNLGSPEAGLSGAFVINTSHLNQRPLYDLPDLAMHEGVPGHHLQIATQQEVPAPWFRRHYQVDAYAEGWAHYAETLGVEMGIFRTPYERFGMLSAQMWRACRLVADTGIHWKGWTLDQARRCFYENSALAPHNIETELQRYIAWPGQALSYKIGQIKMSELRARAEAALGPKFDLRHFHDMILWTGGLPLDLLDQEADRWIAARKAAIP